MYTSFSSKDIDELIKNFSNNPTKHNYDIVNNWYQSSQNEDINYLTCVYLFLLGANIKHRFIPFDYNKHVDFIREIREIVDVSDNYTKQMRKIYLEYGSKSVDKQLFSN